MQEKNHIIISIAGGSGSGKSFFVDKIKEEIDDSEILFISQDNYYKDLSDIPFDERIKTNFDHPDAIDFDLIIHHLQELKSGNKINMPVYDYVTHTRKKEMQIVESRPVIVLEGILILCRDEILELSDLKIFIDTPDDLRIIRRIRRDIKERGRSVDSVIDQYLNTVRPMYLKFVEPSKKYADQILSGEEYNPDIVEQIKKYLS